MRITFVQNFLLESDGATTDKHLYPHLGLISLIAEISHSAHRAELYDPMLQLERRRLALDPAIYGDVAKALLSTEPDVVGFTALGCNFLAVLKIASCLRQLSPETVILLGGPHATVLEDEIMNRFAEFDVLVRGEAEHTIVPLLDGIERGSDLSDVPGISFRGDNKVYRSPQEAPPVNVDELLFPAFHVYPIVELGMRSMKVEAGRGCPFHCTFCSTATFFGRKYRVKNATKLVGELKIINETYDIADFSLQHDLFTVNRRKVLEFCEEVRGCGFAWTCSARIDCVDSTLLTEMARSGCRAIYFGIETGSRPLQELLKKRLDINLLRPTLIDARRLGLNITTSFITGFPQEGKHDLEATLDCIESCIRAAPTTLQVQLHLLTPEPGTALYETHKAELLFDGHISDFNFPALDAAEPPLLRKHPEVFMTHHYYPSGLSRESVIATTTVFPYLRSLGGPLLVAVLDCTKLTLAQCISGLLRRIQRAHIDATVTFWALLSLIRVHGADSDSDALCELIAFVYAHRRIPEEKAAPSPTFLPDNESTVWTDGATTLFQNTFDIPIVLQRLREGMPFAEVLRQQRKASNFVVFRRRGALDSQTLRVSDDLADVLYAARNPQPLRKIIKRFAATEAMYARVAVMDLVERGVLQAHIRCG